MQKKSTTTEYFVIKAPGKVVISGEHAVLYGKSSLVATVNLYTTFEFCFTDDNGNIRIINKNNFPSMNFNIGNLAEISDKFFCVNSAKPHLVSAEQMENIRTSILSTRGSEFEEYFQSKSCFVILLAFLLVVPVEKLSNRGLSVVISSDIPIGQGLGSSASFSACLALLVLFIADSVQINDNLSSKIEIINRWAFCYENIFHGKSSGMDNTCVVYGGIMRFLNLKFSEIFTKHEISFLIIDTKLEKCTSMSVQKVKELNESLPSITSNIFNAINEITLKLKDLLTADDEWDNQKYETISKLIDLNHHLLASLGLESIANREVYSLCKYHGISSKITGGGNNGCMIALSPVSFKGFLTSIFKFL